MIPPSVYLNPEEKIIEISEFPKMMLKVSPTFYEKYEEKKNAEETMPVNYEEKEKTIKEMKEKQEENKNLCEESSDKNICSICCTKESDTIIMNCGHGGICFVCGCELWKEYKKCHICRRRIMKILKYKQNHSSIVEILKAVILVSQ